MPRISRCLVRDFDEADSIQDADAILKLFHLAFKRPLPRAFWEWRYLQGSEKPIIKLMFDGPTLIGHYALNPLPFWLQGKKALAALSLTTMTHPAYQRQGIFTELAGAAYETAAAKGVAAVYGFPNPNSEKGFFEKLNWMRSCSLREWRLEKIKKSKAQGQFSAGALSFDGSYDAFWEEVKDNWRAVIPRTSSFLDWRIARCPPEYVSGHYRQLEARAKGKLQGYLLLKLYRGATEIRGHILELLARDEGTAAELIQEAVGYASAQNAAILSVWMREQDPLLAALERSGFRPKGAVVWGGRILRDQGLSAAELFGNWHMSMLDSDVF